jgi:hypothetical protein
MLSPTQQTTLRTDVQADSTLNILSHIMDSAFAIADAYNAQSTSNTSVWWTACPVDAVFNAVTWANYTPTDVTPTDTALNAQIFTARTLVTQIKQMNLQNMLSGRQTINAAYTNVRSGLRDAVIQLPTGASGAMTTAGGASGVTVMTACIRPTKATRAEKLFSAGASTTGTVTADVLTFEGYLSPNDVFQAMGW